MSAEFVNLFFAWTPLVVFALIVIVAYFLLREERPASVSAGKTYSCARCGRRGRHEHMVPVTHEGAVVWYCARCAH